MTGKGPALLLFDGYCNVCSAGVRFAAARTGADQLQFCPMQTEEGQAWLKRLGEDLDDYASMILLDGGERLYKSDAAIRIGGMMAWPWRLMAAVARWLPRVVRDWLYDRLAINRYRLFGKRDECLIPDRSLQGRFAGGPP